jgi:site-specific DNA recombinase
VIVDTERAPFVKLAFELYATGNYSLERLADELTRRGLRTRPGRYPAGAVSDSKLSAMLRDRYYLGVITYKGVEYPGRHPALVGPELFDHVQEILDASGVSGERRRTHNHYLKGTLWCDRCRQAGRRHRLIITKATGRRGTDYFYFLCRGRQEGVCDLPYLPMEHVEDAALKYWGSQRLPEGFIEQVREKIVATLEETNASLRLLRDQLTAELATIDRQEENLLDLAADAALATDKVRTRLTRLEAQRKEIRQRLADNGKRLTTGAAVLEAQLDLLHDPQTLYRRLSDHGRRLLNQAMFEELLVDREDVVVQVTGQTYTEPVRDLMFAAHAYRQRPVMEALVHASKPAVNGGSARETVADLLSPISLDGGWSKAAMVELRGFEPLTFSLRTRRATNCATAPEVRSKL